MQRKILVFATSNAHKLREVKEIIGDKYEIRSLKDIECFEEIPETADTFRGNALQKAQYVKDKYGYDCIAEDSGLAVDGLGGAPGIYSARYAGEPRSDERNLQKLLKELGKTKKRTARYHSAIALILEGETHFFEGKAEGNILFEKVGTGGFGYDPIVQPIGFDVSFAQLSKEEKNAISHRGEAVRKLTDFFNGKKS